MQYRRLEKGEIIQKGDQCDQCANPWKDNPKWVDVVGNIGEPAPDPAFPSHRQYRRPVCDVQIYDNEVPPGYAETMDRLNRPNDWDVAGIIADTAESVRLGHAVQDGQVLAVIDKLVFGMKYIAERISDGHARRIDPDTIREAASTAVIFVGKPST